LHRVETAETASEGFKTNYQRERQWRETAEKSIDRVKRELTMTKDRLKNDQKIAKEKMAAQERREVMIKEDFQKAMAELPRRFHEQLYECKSQMARKILALYCAIFVLVAVILSSAWLKFIPTWTLETS
jgi:predicted  nucleic acid-binding Zn-ribbon protein